MENSQLLNSQPLHSHIQALTSEKTQSNFSCRRNNSPETTPYFVQIPGDCAKSAEGCISRLFLQHGYGQSLDEDGPDRDCGTSNASGMEYSVHHTISHLQYTTHTGQRHFRLISRS